jgi:putative PIN family toxin of toxin-antitoxin system
VIRAVLDTSVLVSAFIGRRDAAPSQLVAAWCDRRFTMTISQHLIDELSEVLLRPKFARWSAEGRAEDYVAGFAARGHMHADPPTPAATTRDPADDYLVALARSVRVDALVSVDRDLLDADLPDVSVIEPAQFLAQLAQDETASEAPELS